LESGLVAAWLGAELSALTGGIATLIVLAGVALMFPQIRGFYIRGDASAAHVHEPSSAA
jgi:hypothetical protein